MKKKYAVDREGHYPVMPKMTIMQPQVVNVSSSPESVARQEIDDDILLPDMEEKPLDSFGDFDNREDGKVDCSEICKSRGGGGHKGASGFQSDGFLTE